MKLKPQPPVTRRPARSSRATRPRSGARPAGRQARRPGVPLRQRLSGRLPSIRRVLAGLGAAALGAGLVALLGGPWLRVHGVAWAGEHWTAGADLERAFDGVRGTSALAVDTRAIAERLERLPAVAEAEVSASLTGTVEAEIVERTPAFVWVARGHRFIGASDGTVFAVVDDPDALPDELAAIPTVTDERFAARLVSIGDVIGPEILDVALRLSALDPATLGSGTAAIDVLLDDDYGFRLVAPDPGWEIALGVYGLDPNESAAEAEARLERQVTAVRTLFAERPEADIGWVDVRNPGKVYFRAKG